MTLSTLHYLLDDVTTHREVVLLWNVIDACDEPGPMWRYLADIFPHSFADPKDVNSIHPLDWADRVPDSTIGYFHDDYQNACRP